MFAKDDQNRLDEINARMKRAMQTYCFTKATGDDEAAADALERARKAFDETLDIGVASIKQAMDAQREFMKGTGQIN
jgi:hypothetical protein